MTGRAAARRYARALFDVALAQAVDFDAVGRELAEFQALAARSEALQRVLTNPAIPAARKRAIVEQLLVRSPLTPMVGRLLVLLAERDRLALLPDVVEAYQSRLMDHRRVVRAEVVTAMPLPDDRVDALRQGLSRVTGREVLLHVRVDPSLVGGAVARIGSMVYDGSVTTQLERMKQRLVQAEI